MVVKGGCPILCKKGGEIVQKGLSEGNISEGECPDPKPLQGTYREFIPSSNCKSRLKYDIVSTKSKW